MIKRIIIIVSSIIGAIATFLPWVTATVSGFGQNVSESVNGTEGDGYITLVIFAVIAVIALIGINKQALPMWGKVAVTILSVICLIVAIVDMTNVSRLGIDVSDFSAFGITAGTSVSIGLILLAIASIVNAVVAWLPLDKESSKKTA